MSHAEPPSDEGQTPPRPGETPVVPDTRLDAPVPIPPSKRSDRALIEEALNQVAAKSGDGGADSATAYGTFTGYTILREIHRGGQGVVYQAMQLATKRKVAIKVIHGGPFTGSQGRARFDREVQILGQLNHRNIVAIHDSGVTGDGSFFYVMDCISGKSLDEVLRSRSNPSSIDETLSLFIKICDAVNAAHLKGVIHRDLKPANIRIDQNGEPIVVDFGLAKLTTADFADKEQGPNLMTLTGQFVGSLPWASPEQAQGTPNAIDVRTDVYSLGVILYQLLTGKFPYEVVGTMRDVLDNILRAVPSRPSTVRRQINDEVETIVLKCLAKERDRRYQNAGELARDLRHYLKGEPIEAKRDSGLYVISKTLSRYKVAVTIAAAFATTVFAAAIGMGLLYRQSNQQRDAAVQARAAAESAQTLAQQALTAEQTERARADANVVATFEIATSTTLLAAEQISQVQGGTKALASLIKGSTTRLVAIEPQLADKPQLLRKLAAALNRLSEYQSDLYAGRLAEPADAQKNHERALAIRRNLAEKNPQDWTTRADLAQSLFRGATFTQTLRDYALARTQMLEAVAMYDQAIALAAAAPSTPQLVAELADCHRARLNVMRAACYTNVRLAEDAPRDTIALIDASDAHLAQAREEYAALEKAVDAIPAANESLTKRYRGILLDERSKSAMLASDNRKKAAELAFKNGDAAESARQFEAAFTLLGQAQDLASKSREIFESLRTANPQGAEVEDDLFVSNHTQGEAAMQKASIAASAWGKCGLEAYRDIAAAEHARALDSFKVALTHAQNARRSDPWRLRYARSVAIATVKVAKQSMETGDLVRAYVLADESVQIRRDLYRYDPVVRHQRDLGAGLYRAAANARILGDASHADLAARTAAWQMAENLITECRGIFESLRDLGYSPPHSEEVKESMREQATLWMHMGMGAMAQGESGQAIALFTAAKSNLTICGEPILAEPEQATLKQLDELLTQARTGTKER